MTSIPDSYCPTSLSVLGSTGSIGTQTLQLAEAHRIPIDLLTAHDNVKLMEKQVRVHKPPLCALADERAAAELRVRLADLPTRVLAGEAGICEAVAAARSPVTVNAIVGKAGLLPTLAAMEHGGRLALANKESLVVAGEVVMRRAREAGCTILPVDSEHSAIYQCLQGHDRGAVKRLWLTASGGPFYDYSKQALRQVSLAQTLHHPTWNMGAKITVDSATLMNKGFEVIEAVHLFGLPAAQIRVLVHRESIIHSAVEYIDHAVIAQLGLPDMRTCIAYALSAPHRLCGMGEELDLAALGKLTFAEPDLDTFPLLSLARRAIEAGGGVPAVLNAANEVAVAAFLAERLSFVGIFEVVAETVALHRHAAAVHDLEGLLHCDEAARETARRLL
ncbi:MAG: 1-deoxy-D-xylulose-5-phosphate reductoisomerase [Eubacteriales bacterium]